MVDILNIYKALKEAVKPLGCEVYLQERPSATKKKVTTCIVVGLSSAIRNQEIGSDGRYNYYTTSCQFDIIVNDIVTATNPNAMNIQEIDKLTKGLLSLFPIVNTELGIKVSNPQIVIPPTKDDNGFHYEIIRANLTTI